MNTTTLDPTPELPAIKAALHEFIQRLRTRLDEELVSVALFGGAARGRFDPVTSDVNLMLVLKTGTIGVLDEIAAAVALMRRFCRLTLLTLTEADLPNSAEVFPTKFLDIQRHHETLWGRDVAAELQVPRDRLRRQAVRQLMNLHLRLRQVYLESNTRPEILDTMIRRSVMPLLVNLGILLELRSGRPCADPEETLTAAEQAGISRAGLEPFLALKTGGKQVAPDSIAQFYGAFMDQIAGALDFAGPSIQS